MRREGIRRNAIQDLIEKLLKEGNEAKVKHMSVSCAFILGCKDGLVCSNTFFMIIVENQLQVLFSLICFFNDDELCNNVRGCVLLMF